MVEQDELEKIADLTRKISLNYLKTFNSGNIEYLKEKLEDLLTNPLWNDSTFFQLKEVYNKLKLNESTREELWNVIEDEVQSSYSKFLKRKPHIYEGKIKEFEDRLIKFFVQAGKLKGQNVTFSTIIGYFLIHKSLTQDQVKELTGFSKGSVSINLSLLEDYGFLKKKLIKGTRKYLYSFGGDFSQLSMDTGTFKKEINRNAVTFFQSKIKILNEYKDKKGYEILSERLNGIMSFLEIHKKLIEHIVNSEFIKKIAKGKL
ncbi:MAG: hypothetical protein GF311_19400 [Candidatus Lokiarchaeota archaeon]|nr:hypothetical protein [Candidatus Lokiarchaeota archaeon]